MVRKAQPQAITAKMYRHFATLTIACTAALAVFAEGENREARATEVAAPSPKPSAGPTELARKGPSNSGFADDGFDGAFGEPMDPVGAAAHDGIIPSDFAAIATVGIPDGYTRYGVPAHVWATLTEAQKKDLVARHEAELEAARSPARAEQIDSLIAASRARSGEAARSD